MNENQNKLQYNKNEIDLKDLIIALWKRKFMIISITILCSIFAGLLSMIFLSPIYNTKLNIIISMPETYYTRYDEYTMPIKSNEQYVNLFTSNNVILNTIEDMGYNKNETTLDSIKRRIFISNAETTPGTIQNSFEIMVSASTPEESLKLAETLFKNYIEFMDVMTKEMAINYYYENFTVQLKSLRVLLETNKEILEKNEELLKNTSKSYDLDGANIEIQSQLTPTTDYVVPVDAMNPNYIKIENDIIGNKQSINSVENSMKVYNEYIGELELEKQSITKYYESGQYDSVESNIIGVVETSIYLPSPPVAPSQRTSPSYFLIVLVGAVFGGMIGVIVSWVKEFWFN